MKSVGLAPTRIHGCFDGLPRSDVPFIPARMRIRVVAERPGVGRRRVRHMGGRLHSFASHVGGKRAAFSALTHVCSRSPNSTHHKKRCNFANHKRLAPRFTGIMFGLASPGGVSGIFRARCNCRVTRLVRGHNSHMDCHRVLVGPHISRGRVRTRLGGLSALTGSVQGKGMAFSRTTA